MKLAFFIILFSFSAYSVEVAVIEETKSNTEITLSFTDDSLYSALDKAWITLPCKTRFNFNMSLKETFTPKGCRAEVLKFLLNSGYKPLDNVGRAFSK